MADIPYGKLKIPPALQTRFEAGMGQRERFALARGMMPMTDDALVGVCYLLLGDEVEKVATSARETLLSMPIARLLHTINRDSHPKILEFLAEFRPPDPDLDALIYRQPDTNDRTVRLIAQRAGEKLCELVANNQTRLLLTPEVLIDLRDNKHCPRAAYSRAESFLRMQGSLPPQFDAPAPAPAAAAPSATPAQVAPSAAPTPAPLAAPKTKIQLDLEAEIEAALSGGQSPALLHAQGSSLKMFNLDQFDDGFDDGFDSPAPPASSGGGGGGGGGVLGSFRLDFQDGTEEFGWGLTDEPPDGTESDEAPLALELQLRDMAVGKRIKLAFKGNKQVRGVLIRDPNKTVATAVVRSGRMTDGEIVSAAGNRNLADEVIREIASNKEFLRKYPVQVALTGNSKTPVPLALAMLKSLHKKDLKSLARNRNVSSVVSNAAEKLFKQKYQRS